MLRKAMVGLIICIGLLECIVGVVLWQEMHVPPEEIKTNMVTHEQLVKRLAKPLQLETLPMDVPEAQLEKLPGYLLLTSVRSSDGKIATSYIEDCSNALWGRLEDNYSNTFDALPPAFMEMNNMTSCDLFIRTFIETSEGRKEITYDQVNKPPLSFQLIPQVDAGGGILFKIPVSWSTDKKTVKMKLFNNIIVGCPTEVMDDCWPYMPEWAYYDVETGKLVGIGLPTK